jgi:predicted RNA-binding Zn-ribbon protein involved in translation (DUF1610 family)
MKKNAEWNVKCACGCGGDVPKPKRKSRGKYPIFISNHWWKLPEYKERIKIRNSKRTKDIPDIAPCVGRRFRGNKYWSRVLMEEHLGRQLSSNEHVHHINGDKTDDRIENLIVLTHAEHTKLHMDTSPIIEFVCKGCGKIIDRKEYKLKRSKSYYCNQQCFFNSSLKRNLTPKQYNRYFREQQVLKRGPTEFQKKCKRQDEELIEIFKKDIKTTAISAAKIVGCGEIKAWRVRNKVKSGEF